MFLTETLHLQTSYE